MHYVKTILGFSLAAAFLLAMSLFLIVNGSLEMRIIGWASLCFFSAAYLVGLYTTYREYREAMRRTRPIDTSSTLLPEEINERLPVWKAISRLWLDNEFDDSDAQYLAHVLIRSTYDWEKIEDIFLYEVAPAVHGNLRLVAGEWAAFDEDWLKENILRNMARPDYRKKAFKKKEYMMALVAEDWRVVKKYYVEQAESNE